MSIDRNQKFRLAFIFFLVALAAAWFCYRPALSGDFELDDQSNLSALADIEDTASAFNFVFTGDAGPLGRPLALATFALQADQWEQGAAAFLQLNLAIHLLNAVILFLASYQLGLSGSIRRESAIWAAAWIAVLWVMMPLLASSSLLVVQRMTTLSATFVLLGLTGYLAARKRLDDNPKLALLLMSISLVVGTLLSVLCKESGALLPAFVLVLEATVIARPTNVSRRSWHAWQAIFLGLPVALVLGYLATRIHYPDWLIARRDFNAWERLMTEAKILWIYLGRALVGLPANLGIYQTPPAVSRSLLEPLTLVACLAWSGLAAAALAWRRRFPLFALAVLWYLAGHLVESTVVALELYFEHRNYLAVVGPLFALCAWIVTSRQEIRRLAVVVAPFYLLINAFFLWSFASLRGDSTLAANYWAFRYPDSVRAITARASYELASWGPTAALKTLDGFVAEYPSHAYLRIQALNIRCLTAPEGDHSLVVQDLYSELPQADFTYTAGSMLSELSSTVSNVQCRGVDADTVMSLARVLLRNPRYIADPKYNRFHYKLMASIYQSVGDYPATLENLERAVSFGSSAELDMMMVTLLGGSGEYAAAKRYIAEALRSLPVNPIRALARRNNLENLGQYIAALERYSQDEPAEAPATENDES